MFILTETLRVTEGTQAVLHCGTQTTGTVTWSRDTNGQRVDILTTTNGEAKHAADSRYSSGPSLTLIIYQVSRSDAGTYYCNRTTVELTVIPGTGTWGLDFHIYVLKSYRGLQNDQHLL